MFACSAMDFWREFDLPPQFGETQGRHKSKVSILSLWPRFWEPIPDCALFLWIGNALDFSTCDSMN